MSDYIIINDDLRTMEIPKTINLLGVESDDDVTKIPFQMPKEHSGFDLSTFSARINYMNANGEGDVYVVDDLSASGDNLTFNWLVGRSACKYKGNTKFIVCLKKFADDGSGTVLQEFNTTVYSLPVLEGLETTQAVEQQNADVIEYLIHLIDQSGVIDPEKYYTKAQVDAKIPTELPNPESLKINGTIYDGSKEVEVSLSASTQENKSVSGAMIHVVDAVPQAVQNLKLFDASGNALASAEVAVTNKNLFRIDQIADNVVSNGVTFAKKLDGSIKCSGTSSGSDAESTCTLDKGMFSVGKTYTLSTDKVTGFAGCKLKFTFSDDTTATVTAFNSAKTFKIVKPVKSCTASICVLESAVTVDNEIIYPQLEVGSTESTFMINSYDTVAYDGSVMPELPESISNVWANSDNVASIVMNYTADTVLTKVDEYVNENVKGILPVGRLVATDDGLGTVFIGLE